MKKYIVLPFALIVTACCAFAQQPSTEKAPPPAGAMRAQPPACQLVLLKHGPGWKEGVPPMKQEGIREHAKYMMALRERGVFLLGGGLTPAEGEATDTSACMVFVAANPAEARALIEADAATKSLFEIKQIQSLQLTGGIAVAALMQHRAASAAPAPSDSGARTGN